MTQRDLVIASVVFFVAGFALAVGAGQVAAMFAVSFTLAMFAIHGNVPETHHGDPWPHE